MRNLIHRFIIIALLLTWACKTSQTGITVSPIVKEAKSNKGIVVTASSLASRAGTSILEQGGNAIDAAIAVMFALTVVYPEAGNIGGGGFLIYRERNGQTHALDFREKAPAVADSKYYLNQKADVVDSLSQEGIYSIGVPGTVDGIFQMFDKFSKLKNIQTLMHPAIQYAEIGYPLSKMQADQLNHLQSRFVINNKKETSFVKFSRWKQGDLFQQKQLAETLKKIAKNGRDEFYQGKTAECMINTMNAHQKTWISKADLSNYHSVWRTPIQFQYKDYTIISMPPPSSGGVHLAQLFGMYELLGRSDLKFHSSEHIQLFTEFERRVYADRAMFLGDPEFYPVPVKQLLNKNYLKKRIAGIDLQQASDSRDFIDKDELSGESEETTHFSIIDKDGNAASITTTLNGSYGSFVVAEGAGFLLNNEMDDFSVKPGVPNAYGLIGSKANAIAANKRMLSSMTPTIVVRGNRVEYIVGTPGGSTIITSVFQVLMNLIEFHLSPSDAVQSLRFHHQLLPDCIYFEKGILDKKLFTDLKNKKYNLLVREQIGRVELIAREGDSFIGVADQRGDDSVAIEN